MGRNNTKTKPAASAPDGGDIDIQPPTGRFSFENFGEWLTEHGYRLAVEDPPSESDIDTRKLFLTIFKDEKGATKKKGEHTLPEWADIIRTAHATIKDELLWLKGARFGDLLSDKGSYRTNKNVEALTAIVVEHDKGDVDFDHALTCVREAGVRAAGYTSPSYQKSIREKWRFIFPLSKDESPERHEILVAYANGIFHGALSNESFVLSQSYYFGSVNHNPDHRVEIVDGQFLDLADRLFAGRLYKGGTKEEPTPRAQRRKKNTAGPKSFWDTANDVFTNPEVDKDELVAALNIISADCVEPIWFEICCGLRHELGEDGFDIFDQWSATAKTEGKYDADVCKEKWKHAEDLEHAYTAGTIFKYANDADPDWKQKWQDSRTPPPDADDPPDSKTPPPKDKKPKPPLITATPFTLRDPSAIPQREWLYGRHLIRKMGSATIAPGGAGKSSLVIVEALAMVTGRPLLGITPQQCCKVWLWNGEDPLEEIERRIAAACEHFRIKAKDLEGNLFVNGRESEIIIAQQTRDGVKVAVPMVEALVKTLRLKP